MKHKEDLPETGTQYKNKAKCKLCKTVIESTFRHDMVGCKCGAIFVDGGNDYWRAGGQPEHFERIWEEIGADRS